MKKVLSVAAVALALSATAVQAHEGYYAGAGYQAADFKLKDLDRKFAAHTLNLNVGYDFNEYLAVEGRIGVPMSSEKQSWNKDSIEGKPTTSYAVFGKGTLPLTDMFSVYALAGYGKSGYKFDANLPSLEAKGDAKFDKASLQYAAGVEVNFTQNIAMTAEYGVYGSGKNYDAKYDIKGFNLGLKYKF
ncbi:porin family protein [Vibrio tubiashii]|uniref:porin family protein n=1 Tax=Vibrio tubiashii TaxID=29498 RepID=UPI001EFE502A|nr:porin family protein [Vibrio tubiashii]MCG9575068.1 porin family protein [Vibrio tubiashii]